MKRIILICAVLLSPGILSGIALGQEDGEKILVNPLPPVTPMDITVQMLVDQGTIEARATLEEGDELLAHGVGIFHGKLF